MNSQSNAMPGSGAHSQVVAPAEIPPTRRFYWLLQRELWENRSVYLAPLTVAAIALLGAFVAILRMPTRIHAGEDPHIVIEQPYLAVALAIMAIEIIVAAIYSLDALYGERRDRSVLFWKSLPVSDFSTVLAKATVAILILPLIAAAATVAVQFIMLAINSAVFAASGLSAASVWTHVPFFKTAGINIYHLVVFHGIWYAPFYGWFLLASAWAKRTPFLWAVVPPVAIGLLEKIAFNTNHFGMLIFTRFGGGGSSGGSSDGMTMDMLAPEHAVHFLFSWGLWLGLLLTAAFLFAASRLRRLRTTN